MKKLIEKIETLISSVSKRLKKNRDNEWLEGYFCGLVDAKKEATALIEAENKLHGWIVRDELNCLYFHQIYPDRIEDRELKGYGTWGVLGSSYIHFPIPGYWYKELTWESEPLEVELTIDESQFNLEK